MLRGLLLSALLLAAGFTAGFGLTARMHTAPEAAAPPPRPEPAAPAAPAQAASPAAARTTIDTPPVVATPGPDFTGVASRAVKGVANISSIQVVRRPDSPFASDPFFRYFFGDPDMGMSRDRRALSLGSGVVISADGYVITNSHVVGEDVRRIREVRIGLSNKREITGTVVGTDPATDIALLKIQAAGLEPIPWGDSSRLQVGEWVLAIGSPFQLSQTVTAGIVSATGRTNLQFADYEDFIQTDAAINPGNSGGALINSRGELVGINTGIFSQSGGYQGIGFAVPSNLARHVVDHLMKYGTVRRGTILGVRLEPLTPRIAEELGALGQTGAVVTQMLSTSDAYAQGLRPEDIIVSFNGRAIEDMSQLSRLIADAPIGSTATIRVLRGGRTLDLKIPIVAYPRGR